MSRLLIILFILSVVSAAFGQDSRQRIDSTKLKVPASDSAWQKVNTKTRSLQGSLPNKLSLAVSGSILQKENNKLKSVHGGLTNKFDSLKRLGSLQRIKDSLNIHGWANRMKSRVASKISLDSLDFIRKIDSLRSLDLPTRRFRKKLDSLQNRKAALMKEINGKQSELQSKVSKRYDEWASNVRNRLELDSLSVIPPRSDLGEKLPGELKDPLNVVGLPQTSGLPNGPGLPEIPGIPALNDKDFSDLGLSGDLVKAGGNLSIPSMDQIKLWNQNIPSLGGIQNQMKDYTQTSQLTISRGKKQTGLLPSEFAWLFRSTGSTVAILRVSFFIQFQKVSNNCPTKLRKAEKSKQLIRV